MMTTRSVSNMLQRGETTKMVGLSCSALHLNNLKQVIHAGRRPLDESMLKPEKTLGF